MNHNNCYNALTRSANKKRSHLINEQDTRHKLRNALVNVLVHNLLRGITNEKNNQTVEVYQLTLLISKRSFSVISVFFGFNN